MPVTMRLVATLPVFAERYNKTAELARNAEDFSRDITRTARTLRAQSDLSPSNPVVNRTLSRFVRRMTAPCDAETLRAVRNDPRVMTCQDQLLRDLSRSECEMEKHWSRLFLQQALLTPASLKQFLYHDNYEELTDLELAHWARSNDRPGAGDHVVFVGSGALPLTAILLQIKTGARVTCVDCDPGAVDLSRRLIAKLGLADRLAVMQANGETADFTGATHVIVAALVPDHAAVVRQVLQRAALARIGVRSAEGLRTMLYPPTDVKKLEQLGMVATGRSETNRRVINTMETFRCAPRIMRVPAQAAP